MRKALFFALVLGAATGPTSAADELPSGDQVVVRLKDGSQLVGRIVSEGESEVEVLTQAGPSVRVPRESVESIRRWSSEGAPDPNDSRLFFAPTGRPLRKGEGQVTDHYALFPGVSYGVTDNLTLMGGVSIIPGLGLREQLVYVAPKIGHRISERLALSAGYLYARAGEEGLDEGAGVGFGVATFGTSEKNLTAGFGVAHSSGRDTRPILMLGGQARISKRLFFLTENWFILGDGFDLGQQPFSAGLRLCGDRLSVDFGLILVGELLDESVPIPWLSFSYQFGRSGKGRMATAHSSGPLLRAGR